MRRRLALLPLLLASLAGACLPGGHLPEFQTPASQGARPLAPVSAGGSVPARLAVAFAGPSGDDIEGPSPTVVFSRPMRKLGEAPELPRLPAAIEPQVEGRWIWVGTSAVKFVPRRRFARGTSYRVALGPGITAPDGQRIDEPVELHFSTPRLKLNDHYRHEGPRGEVQLHFDQDVDPAALASALSVLDRAGKPVAVKVTSKEPHTTLAVTPEKPWPRGALRLKVSGALRGVEGPLPLGDDREVVVGRDEEGPSPAFVESLECTSAHKSDCIDGTAVRIELSRPVRAGALRPLLRVTPPLPFQLAPSWGNEPEASSFELTAAFAVGKTYTVEVQPSPRGKTPGPISLGQKRTFAVRPQPSSFSFLVHGTYLPPPWTDELEATGDAPETIVAAAPLDLDAALRLDRNALDDAGQLPGARRKTLTLGAHGLGFWGLGDLIPERPGPLLLSASFRDWQGPHHHREVLQRTDLGLTVLASPEGTLAWVTRLSTGKPVADAEVEARDHFGRKASARTDGEGLARLSTLGLGELPERDKALEPPLPPWRRRRVDTARGEGRVLVAARSGDDWLFKTIDSVEEPPMQAALFLERGLYRPGDTVHVKGVVRRLTSRGLVPPEEGREVTLKASLPGNISRTFSKKLSAWGTFHHDLELPADVPLGGLSFSLEGPIQPAYARGEVSEFRSATFKVEASLDRKVYTRGDELRCGGKGTFLFGGSMADVRAHISVIRRTIGLHVPGFPRHEVGDHVIDYPSRELLSRRGSLDASSSIAATVKLDLPDQSGPEQVVCMVSADDGSDERQETALALVHPADFYIAIEGPLPRLRPGDPLRPGVLALTPDGARRSARVKLDLRSSKRDPDDSKRIDDTSHGSCTLTTAEAQATCELRLPATTEPGAWYRLEATATDGKDRSVRTSLPLSILGADERRWTRPTKAPEKPKPPAPPFLALDRERYAPDARARLSLTASRPYSAALVSLEREGVVSHRLLGPGEGASSLDLPLDPTMAPRLWLGATFLSPTRSEGRGHAPAAARERASTAMEIELPSRRLGVRLLPGKTSARPGDELDVDIDVSDPQGKGSAAEVTFYAVDEGTLDLTGYHAPELDYRLSPEAQHLVSTSDTFGSLAWLYRPGRGRLGGSHRAKAPQIRMGATSVSRPRGDFRPTAFYFADLVTDQDGHVRAHVKLPEGLTTYRLMAVAVSKGDRYGAAELPLTTSLPLQIRPIPPRVVRAGDRFEVTASLANNDTAPAEVVASMQAEGLRALPQEPRRLTLAPGQSQSVSFPIEAPRAGVGRLTFQLVGPAGAADSAVVSVPVQSPLSLEAAALFGSTEGKADEQVADLGKVRDDVGSLELTLSSSAVSGLAPGLEQLVEYPYGCTEQLTSRLVPLLSLRDLGRSLGVALPQDLDSAARQAVDRLLTHRHPDGRFGLWAGSQPSPWLTTYALWGLSQADRHGIAVDREVLRQGAALLIESALGWSRGEHEAAEACFALDVLADLPDLDPAPRDHVRMLAEQLAAASPPLPPFARAHLLHALASLGAGRDALDPLVQQLASSLHLDASLARAVSADGDWSDQLDSSARTGALVLRALLAADPKHPLLERLARGLVADRGPSGWRTTQETAWALIALDAYRRSVEAAGPAPQGRVLLGGREVLAASFGDEREKRALLGLDSLAGQSALRFEALRGQVHYQARLRYAPRELPADPLAAGLEVTKRCATIPDDRSTWADDAWRSPSSTFKRGASVLCELEVISPSPRRFVALDDPLPGGFEPVDLHLRGTPSRLRSLDDGSYTRRELRDDRVVYFIDRLPAGVHRWSYVARATTAGTFLTPPTRVEEMYAPETYGRTASARWQITP